MRGKKVDIIGKKFGKLTVISFDSYKNLSDNSDTRRSFFLCSCECGNSKIVNSHLLISGGTRSCGCLRLEAGKKFGAINGLKLGKVESSFNDLYSSYRNRSKIKNRYFNLSKDEFSVLTKGKCYYYNKEPAQIKKKQSKLTFIGHDYIYNGIDRVDSSLGYSLDNCVPCCGVCNKMKLSMSHDEFIGHMRLILENMDKKNE